MRRLGLVAVCLFLVAPAAIALARALPPGDGTLVVRNARGVVTLQVKGAVIGSMKYGKLTLTDNDPYDEYAPFVRGRNLKTLQVNDSTKVYKGRNIRYRMLEGSYRLKLDGVGIHLSAVGRGWVSFDGDDQYVSDGVYSLNGAPFEPIPADPTDRMKLQVAPVKPQRINQP